MYDYRCWDCEYSSHADTLIDEHGRELRSTPPSLEVLPVDSLHTSEVSEGEHVAKSQSKRRRKVEAAPNVAAKSPLASGILENLTRFPHCILLTRVGQFYESYFDQAKEVSRLLGIKLTQKTWDGQRVWMCGFPLMHVNKYLKILVQHHQRFVAMCEEFPRSPQLGAKGGFDRRVVRIVTPGTLIDEPFLNPYENNYLLSITPGPPRSEDASGTKASRLGLAWIDVSTGEFFTKITSLEGLRDELARISPREVVLDKEELADEAHPIRRAVAEEGFFLSFFSVPTLPDADDQTFVLEDHCDRDDVTNLLDPSEAPIGPSLSEPEVCATTLLTAFLRANLLEHMPQLSAPSRESTNGRMQIDSNTIKALEIREGISDGGVKGSLLSVVKRTVTSSGTRLLARWLCSPSTSLREINARQSLVAFFRKKSFLREDLVQSLGDIEDATRIVQRFLLGRGQASDLLAICSTIESWTSIKKRIELERKMEEQENGHVSEDDWASLDALMCSMNDLRHLSDRIDQALVRTDTASSEVFLESGDSGDDTATDTRSISIRTARTSFVDENWTIKPEFSDELNSLHLTLKELLKCREKLERQLQLTYDAPSLTLRSSPGQGMHVHIGRGKRDSAKLKTSPLFIPISESNSTNTFFHQQWSQLGAELFETVTAIYIAEKEAFESLRREVNAHATLLRQNARILDELDVTIAFASFALEMNLVRPVLREDMSYHVVNGRHPTVELGLLTVGRTFTPNTVSFSEDSHLHIITGPNMAGKSTLLRQTALISILAQTGSFVPADSAEIGIVDKVFSRVGAKDDLFHDRSTFMVEMLETSNILRRATPNSLVIMDEVGRGTTVEDGLAIAFATVHHVLSVNRCRALFATHFHELADMLGHSPHNHRGQGPFARASFFCTDVDETEDGYFAYSHRLRPGVNRDSHGLKVAQLAGLPDSTLEVAKAALCWLKERRATNEAHGQLRTLGNSLASLDSR
ncbi:muts domain V-domain-containing protein [Sparassis latifolia]